MADRKAFLLRIDPALWAELEAWAQDDLRSVNGQVEYLLKLAVSRRKRGVEPPATPPYHALDPIKPEEGGEPSMRAKEPRISPG